MSDISDRNLRQSVTRICPSVNGVSIVSSSEEVAALRRALGRRLADLRKTAGYSQEALAPLTGYGRSTVANVEIGRQSVPLDFWQRCDDALGADGQLAAMGEDLHRRVQERRAAE